jgi:hypothetical protein
VLQFGLKETSQGKSYYKGKVMLSQGIASAHPIKQSWSICFGECLMVRQTLTKTSNIQQNIRANLLLNAKQTTSFGQATKHCF